MRRAAPGLLLAIGAALLFAPPAEFILGGWDPGVYLNSAVALARHGTLANPDAFLAAAGPAAQDAVVAAGFLQPGFYWDPHSNAVVTQFPFLLTVFTALAAALGGPAAGLWAPVAVGTMAVLALWLFARQVAPAPVAFTAAALLAAGGLQLWHARLHLAEILVQLVLFTGLAAALAWLRPTPPASLNGAGSAKWAALAGLALGILPLVKTEAAVIGLVAAGLLALRPASRSPWFWTPYLVCTGLAAAVYLTLAWPAVRGQAAGAAAMVVSGDRWQASGGLSFPEALWAGLYGSPLDAVLLTCALMILVARLAAPLFRRGPHPGYPGNWPARLGCTAAGRRDGWVFAVLAVGCVLYLAVFLHYYNAREVIPLFLWSARRLVPVVLPIVVLAEAWALWKLARRLPPPSRRPVLALALALLLLARLPEIALLREHREYEGAWLAVAEVAQAIDPRAIVLVQPDDTGIRFAAPLRFIHDIPTYIAWPGASREGLDRMIQVARESGRPVYFLAGGADPPSPPAHTVPHVPQRFLPVARFRFELPELQRTSAGRPRQWLIYTAAPALYRLEDALPPDARLAP